MMGAGAGLTQLPATCGKVDGLTQEKDDEPENEDSDRL
jgi:hypothetical protein